jgi:hypothetical protein
MPTATPARTHAASQAARRAALPAGKRGR